MPVSINDRKPINAVKYSAADFPSFFDSLMRRLKVEYGDVYNDYATTSVGIMLVDLMAYACGELNWYLNRIASDCFLDTARTRSAVARLVKQIGYKMQPAAAATVELKIDFDVALPGPGMFKAGHRFQGPNDLTFEVIAQTLLPTGTMTVTVPAREGETRTISFTGSGLPNQSWNLSGIRAVDGVYCADESVRLWVDGGEWTENQFLEFEKTDQFEVGYNDDPPILQTGDGIAGNIPPASSDVKIQYVIIHGDKGNAKANTIRSTIDPLYIAGNEIDFTVTNEDGASGGTEPQTAESARTLAPFSFAARGAAITLNDYITLANGYSDSMFGTVAKASAINVRASESDAIFIGYIDAIKLLLTNYIAAVSPIETSVSGDIDDALVAVSACEDNSAEIDVIKNTLITNIGTCSTSAASIKNESEKSASAYDVLADGVDGANILIDAYVTDPTENALIKIQTGLCQAAGVAMRDAAAVAGGAANTIVGAAGAMDRVVQSAISPDRDLEDVLTDLDANLVVVSTKIGDAQTDFATIPGTAATLDTDVESDLDDLSTYVSTLFDADCKSNLVNVPIVALDSDGFYVSPSTGLINGLQTYLDGVKEVTHVVKVFDGSVNLVEADIDITVKVLDAYVAADVISDMNAAMDDLLKGRDYNNPLYLDDVYKELEKSSNGIDYFNAKISGDVDYLDSSGNLATKFPSAAPKDYRTVIVTKGTITITETT